MDNQRLSNRIPFEHPIQQLLVYGPDAPIMSADDEFIPAHSRNLSANGLGCTAERPLQPLTQVFIMFSLPAENGGRMISTDGYIAHSRRENGLTFFGLQFISMAPSDRAAIEAYIAAHQPDPAG